MWFKNLSFDCPTGLLLLKVTEKLVLEVYSDGFCLHGQTI